MALRAYCLLLILCIFIVGGPAIAGRVVTTPVIHPMTIFQAYPGNSDPRTDGALNECWLGYLPQSGDVITAVPGILCIDPGCADWCNFVAAAQEEEVPYTIKNTTLVKVTPNHVQCKMDGETEILPAHTFTQQGTPNIRMQWPLMYEVPGTTFTLSILYGTPSLYDDDGAGPNPPAWVHLEQWIWTVSADFESLSNVLALFHELPFGQDEVPLISDEPFYDVLQAKIAAASDAYDAGDLVTASLILADFELEVMDACIDTSPSFPNPTGPGTGIANSDENPACCKLMIDVEFILQTTGIGQPNK